LERQGGLRRPGEVVVRDDGTSVMSSMSSPPGIERQVHANDLSTEETSAILRHDEEVRLSIEFDMTGGDGGDSDIEGDEFTFHHQAMIDAGDRSGSTPIVNISDEYDGKLKGYLRLTGQGGNNVVGHMNMLDDEDRDGHERSVFLSGDDSESSGRRIDPKKVKIFGPPQGYIPPQARNDSEPKFEDVDNPGDWSRFYYKPAFEGRSKAAPYKHHCLPTGAIPVPVNAEGERKINGWEFHYKGWENPEMPYRRGATTNDLMPKEMRGCVDVDILKKLGMDKGSMKDPLFFYQLILPICDPLRSGIEDDPRMGFYTEVEKFTNMSKAESGAGGTYGHRWKQTDAAELTRFDGVLIRDGVLGGSQGGLHRRWDKECKCHHDDICKSMTFTRYCELKRALKLCHNGSSPQRGEEGYDPAYKYDLIYNRIVHNCNAISKYADENLTVDETTWGYCGYGEAGSKICGRLTGKKKPKGGQTAIASDAGWCRPRAYVHRHKLHVYPPGFTREGCSELHQMLSKLKKMVISEDDPPGTPQLHTPKRIYRNRPTVSADNYFIDDKMSAWIGENLFGIVATTPRNFLPKDIKHQYLQKEKTQPGSLEAKAARFSNPIVAVKNVVVPETGVKYQRVLVSFQSTSSCNIQTVNALNECNLFAEIRERGKGKSKRYWGIEMNHARRLYLSTYGQIDNIDFYIKSTNLFYCTWKYWHAPKNHAIALAIVTAYDIYRECAQGEVETDWKVEKKDMMGFHKFREKLSDRMLKYTPKATSLPGDEAMRAVTAMPISARAKRGKESSQVTSDQFKKAKRFQTSRLCGDLNKFCKHVESIVRLSNKPRICAFCGLKTYTMCGICKDEDKKAVPLHYNSTKGEGKGMQCFYMYHNDSCFGLGKNDSTRILNGVKSNWEFPTLNEIRDNSGHVRDLSSTS